MRGMCSFIIIIIWWQSNINLHSFRHPRVGRQHTWLSHVMQTTMAGVSLPVCMPALLPLGHGREKTGNVFLFFGGFCFVLQTDTTALKHLGLNLSHAHGQQHRNTFHQPAELCHWHKWDVFYFISFSLLFTYISDRDKLREEGNRKRDRERCPQHCFNAQEASPCRCVCRVGGGP